MKLQTFDGGLSTSMAPQLLQLNQAVEFENIDNATGILAPVQTAAETNLFVGKFPYFFRAEDKWVTSDVQRSYVEYQNTLYFTDGNIAKKLKNDVEHDLGISPPTAIVALSKIDAPEQLTEVAAKTITTSGNLPTSELKYIVVNINSTGYYSKALEITISASTTKTAVITTSSSYPPNFSSYSIMQAAAQMRTEGVMRSIEFRDWKGPLSTRAELYRLYNGKYRKVAAITALTDIVVDAVTDISANDELPIDAFGPLSGTYSYVYTYYNSADGTESAPSPVSEELEVGSGKIMLLGMAISPDSQVDKKRIYRVGGNVSAFTLVDTVLNDVVDYTDLVPDVDLVSQLLESTLYDQAPSGLKYLTEAYAMLFGAVDTKLYFTPIGKPNAWPGSYFLDFAEEITGIGVVANGLLVFTKYRTYIVAGTGPTTLTKYLLSGDQGCLNHFSIANLAGACAWVSTDGVCVSNGSIPTVVTKRALGKLALQPLQAIVHDEIYYLIEETGSILALDYRFTLIMKRLMLQVSSLVVANDILYGYRNGRLCELFAGAATEQFKYKSPRLIEGRATEQKVYKKVYIYSKGTIQLKVYINDLLVATGNYDDEDAHVIQVPQDLQRGFFIQFEITGTGSVYELEYEAGSRKDG